MGTYDPIFVCLRAIVNFKWRLSSSNHFVYTAATLAPSNWIEHRFVVEEECDGWRLDRFLKKKVPRLSRSRLQRVIRGICQVNGRDAKPSQSVRFGAEVVFLRPPPPEPEVVRQLTVLYEDDDFYAIDKPPGIAMHPTAKYHNSTITAVLREQFPSETLQITHRLDLETSGVLLVARTRSAAIALKRKFADRQVKKTYLALVHGRFSGQQLVETAIGVEGGLVRVRMATRPDGLPARTIFSSLAQCEHHSLVSCAPETGRQHQIRVHLASIGFPIVGDKLYPDPELFLTYQDRGWSAVADRLPLPRHALHAARLTFSHPSDANKQVSVQSPLPADLAQFWQDAGGSIPNPLL